MDVSANSNAMVAAVDPGHMSQDKEQVLWGVAQSAGAELSESEREINFVVDVRRRVHQFWL